MAKLSEGMERLGGEEIGRERSIKKVALASSIGATIEWYDFFIYGTAAGLVFNQLFFPNFDPLVGTLAAYATFAAGFVARPVGGVIFGHFGDRIGRKTMLILTLLIMGVATFLIGLLPTYESIGIWAPILLLTLRLLQGIGLGGEYGGAVLMAVEHAPRDGRGYYGSWPQMGVPAGLLLGTAAFALLSLLPDEQFYSWGWRVAFLASAIFVVVGTYIRLRIMESPAFTQVREAQDEAQIPFVELVRTQPKEVILGMGMRFAEGVAFNVYGVFIISYIAGELGLPRITALLGVTTAAAVACVFIPIYGALSDRIGRRPVFASGAAFFGLFALPSFLLINTAQTVWIIVGLVIAFGVIYPAMYGPLAAFWSEMFDTRVRYSGVSFVYQFSGIFASGLTPLIATSLLAEAGGEPWLVAAYMVVVALISIAAAYFLKETFRKDITPTAANAQKESGPLAEPGS
jgi:MFS transporter, MHS family, shikimate and dehydroshikimate transport protein